MRITEGVDLIEDAKRWKGEVFKRENRISMQEYFKQSKLREKELTNFSEESDLDSNYQLDPSGDIYKQFMNFARRQAFKHTHSVSGKHPLASLK